MSSFTSASQHYSDYTDMPMTVHPQCRAEFEEAYVKNPDPYGQGARITPLEFVLCDYVAMVDNGVPIYEARMILPNASTVNIIWTVNARSLLNFFEQRLCKRNVDEMTIVANKIWDETYNWWPEYANLCGPACWLGKCNQGKMTCGSSYERR
jgi:thymidylate synthase ThyX